MPRFPFFGYPSPYYYRRQGYSNFYPTNYGYTHDAKNRQAMSNKTVENSHSTSLETTSDNVSETMPISNDYTSTRNEKSEEKNDGKSERISTDTSSQREVRSYTKNKSRYNNLFSSFIFQNPSSMDLETPVFELFGIKLYLDDLIILGLLFFLYKEGVKDDMLFLSLIMLLLN